MRDLVEAASSRAIIERQMMHRAAPSMADTSLNWETWALTPGGIVYSLNPIDQGRLLAVGLHKLLERLVAAEIPMIFLSFPRFTQDAAYLFRSLRPLLPPGTDEARATQVLASVVDAGKVRVGSELAGTDPQAGGVRHKTYEYPSADKVDNIALRRELTRLRREADGMRQDADALRQEGDGLRRAADDLRQEVDGWRREADGLCRELYGANREADDWRREADGLRRQVDQLRQEVEGLSHQIDIVPRRPSWWLLQPPHDFVTMVRSLTPRRLYRRFARR